MVVTQDFEDLSLFSDDIVGSQPLRANGQPVGEFGDAGVSRIRHGSGRSPSATGLSLEARSPGNVFNTHLSFVAPASSTERLRVFFYAYNPFGASYNVVLQRAGGPQVTRTIPPQQWTLVSAELTSPLGTSAALIYLGLIPDPFRTGWSFKMDDLKIERCTQ